MVDASTRGGSRFLKILARIFGFLFTFALGAVFIYSAYTKSGILIRGFRLYANDNAYDNFQWTFLDMGINNIFITQVIAHVMIALELLLGLFLIFQIFLRGFTYKAVIGVLLAFIVYLTVVFIKQGNTGNCGCFGDQVAMTPLAAIIKNVIMIAVTLLLWFLHPLKPYRFQEYFCLLLGLVAFSLPFVAMPMYTGTDPVPCKKPIDLNALYQYTDKPEVELRSGRHILSFKSLTCPHCRKAAHLLRIIHREHPDLPIYFILVGPQQMLKNFYDETQAKDVPHLYFASYADFEAMINAGVDSGAHSGVPAIYWVDNDTIRYKSTYYQLDPEFMKKWVQGAKK